MLDHRPNPEEALGSFRGQYPIMLGYLNVELYEDQNPRIQLVSNLLTEFGLIDFMHHLQKCLCCHHLKTWTQVLQATVFRAR